MSALNRFGPFGKRLAALLCAALCALFLVSTLASTALAETLPSYKLSYVRTTHHTPLMVAAVKGQEFKDFGTYLRPLIPREKYELVSGGKPIAIIDLILAKSGSESATMFAQGQIDLAMASVTAIMAGIDKGTRMHIVAPLQTEGMALVAPKDAKYNDFASFVAFVKASKLPVKVGYHSPTSAPKILLERALKEAGLKVSEDPNDYTAKVLLADLKETSNMLPALATRQVEAIVGPSPFPEVAVTKGAGKIVFDLRDMPPKGFWLDFPCCVVAASDAIIKNDPKVVKALVDLTLRTNTWCNTHKPEVAKISADWIGIDLAAAQYSTLVFLPGFTQAWVRWAGVYMDLLDSMGNFKGSLKGKKIDEVKPLLFDFAFAGQPKK
ncbi:MAG: ABC transporter substrate-binding protein [Humidesulfovibrio sp.]|nr:ABC transporter substrate-binding protein [Humidesulfovibrio sp.]